MNRVHIKSITFNISNYIWHIIIINHYQNYFVYQNDVANIIITVKINPQQEMM